MEIVLRFGFRLALAILLFDVSAQAETLLYTDHPLVGKLWDMRSHRYLGETALLDKIQSADILLLGETHDNPQHHDIQLKLLKARIASGTRPALLMEQLDTRNQSALNLALANSNHDEALNRATGLITFTDQKFYRPFLAAAIDNKLPVIAANISSQQLQPVIWQGFAAYDAAALKRMAVEEVWSERRQNYLLRHIGGAHCGQVRDSLRDGLARSQRLRDALMADAAVSSIEQGIVAIVGSSHARRDVGMPIYLADRNPSARIISIGFVEVSPGRVSPEDYDSDSASDDVPYDVIWFTPRVARANPCADLDKK